MKATKVEILRESIRRVVPILAGRNIEVTQVGMQAYVSFHAKTKKPILVNVPYVPDNASDALITAVQGFIDHEVAHILFSDAHYIEQAKAAKVSGLQGILEDTFIERRMKEMYRGSNANLTQTWQFVTERIVGPGIEKAVASGDPAAIFDSSLVPIMRFWSGQKDVEPTFKLVQPHIEKFIAAIGDDLIAKIPQIKSSADSFKLAVAMHNRIEEMRQRDDADKGKGDPSPDGDDGEGDEGESGSSDSGPMKSTDDSSKATHEVESDAAGDPASESDAKTNAEESDAEGEESDEDSEETGEGSPSPGDEDDAEDEEGDEGEDDGEQGDAAEGDGKIDEGESDGEDPEEEKASGEEKGDPKEENKDEQGELTLRDKDAESILSAFEKTADMDKMMDVLISDEISRALGTTSYFPFSKDFDKIEEFKPEASVARQMELLDRLETEVATTIAPLQRHLERCISAKSHARMISGYRSGRIDPTALHRIVTGDERIFRRKFMSKTKDVAVSLVVDLSGSMTGSKVRLAMQSAFAMSVSLDRLNIAHEVIGFTTVLLPRRMKDGRDLHDLYGEVCRVKEPSRVEPIFMPIFKPFGSRLTIDRKRAMACHSEIELRNNCDGESVEYAGIRLAGRSEARKIMIVMSDGQPFAGAGNYHEQSWHLTQTIKRFTEAGIEMFGIGVMDDSVSRYYPQHVVLNDLSALASTVMLQLEKMLLDPAKAA